MAQDDTSVPLDPHKPWRRWIFVINNYTEIDVEKVRVFADHDNVELLTSGFEKGTKAEVPHIQGQFILKKKQRLSWLKPFLPRAHFDPQKKSAAANIHYTLKDDNVCVIKGEIEQYLEEQPKKSKKREREEIAEEVYHMMVDGCTENQIRLAHPIYWMYNFRMLESARKRINFYKRYPESDYSEDRDGLFR